MFSCQSLIIRFSIHLLIFKTFLCGYVIYTCFVDQKDESFYTASWACNVDGNPFLVAGGINGIMRVIDCGSEKIDKVS